MAASLEGFRLSPQQRRLWRLQEAHGAAPFRARALLRLTGPLSPDDLAAALSRVVDHAEILRTVFQRLPGLSLPVQSPDPSFRVRIEMVDAGDLEGPPAAPESPLTVRLARLAPEEHLALLDLPALCADERSLVNLAGEIAAALAEGEGYAPELLPYSQFAEWQNGLLEDEDAADGRTFWESQGLAAVPPLALPMASPAAGAFAPQRVEVDLPPGLADHLVCLAAWQVLLGRLTGRDEVVTGLLDDGRGHETLEGAPGLFARVLPVRAALPPGLPFAELVRRLGDWTEGLAEWAEHFRMTDALPAAAGEPDGGHFAAGFAWQERPAVFQGGAVAVRAERCAACCERFDLLLSGVRQDGALRLELVYDAGRISREDAATAGRLFAHLLANAAAAPETLLDDLELLSPDERAQVVVAANQTAVPVPAGTLHRLFSEQAARTPGRPAVVFAGEEITFAELEARSNRLARHLRALGVGPDVPVGLLLERSADWIVALLAVLGAGGAYLPLDPTFPVERLAGILAESGAPVVVTREGLVPSEAAESNGLAWVRLDADAAAIDAWSGDALPEDEDRTGPDHLAYVLYTSGTTGRPKGVMIRHGAVVNLLAALRQAIYLHHQPEGAALRVSVNAPFTFDASVKQWIQLLAGATLVLVPEEARPDAEKLLDFVRRSAVDVLDCTPSQLRGLLDAGLAGPGETAPAAVLVGGEAIDAATWDRLARLGQEGPTRFYNVYGPTECTVDVTARPVDTPGTPRPSLGHPLANVRCHVADERLRPVPWWVAGELLVGGAGLARGYLAQPALTAERFVPDPFGEPGSRLYRTGDMVRRLPGGELEFLGRRDHQVKVRGFRIELEEIEGALAEHPAVRQAAAAVRESEGGPSLAAYVTLVPDAGGEIVGELRAWLRRRLPEFMVPGAIIPLADLPLTRHGKVDRGALPDPGAAATNRPAYQPPQSEAERKVAAVWQEVLGVEAVGVDDNFFDLGGHSLLMVRAHGRLQEAFGRAISMVEMFRFPTVGSFAAYLSQGATETVSLAEVRDRADRQRQEQERQRAAMERLRRSR